MLELVPALGVAGLDHTAQPNPWRVGTCGARSCLALRLVTFPPRYRSALEPSGELTPTWLARIGEAAMTGVLNDLLLFSCLAAFVTGVVIAAATILI